MSDGYDSHQVAAIGGTGGGGDAAAGGAPKIFPGGVLGQMLGINPAGCPGIDGLNTPGFMEKKTFLLGQFPGMNPLAAQIKACLEDYNTAAAKVSGNLESKTGASVEPMVYHDTGWSGGDVHHGLSGGSSFVEAVSAGRGGETEIG